MITYDRGSALGFEVELWNGSVPIAVSSPTLGTFVLKASEEDAALFTKSGADVTFTARDGATVVGVNLVSGDTSSLDAGVYVGQVSLIDGATSKRVVTPTFKFEVVVAPALE